MCLGNFSPRSRLQRIDRVLKKDDHQLIWEFAVVVSHRRGLKTNEQGQRRIAVNLRVTEPGPIRQIPVDHFDGLNKWEDLPRDGRCIEDTWF